MTLAEMTDLQQILLGGGLAIVGGFLAVSYQFWLTPRLVNRTLRAERHVDALDELLAYAQYVASGVQGLLHQRAERGGMLDTKSWVLMEAHAIRPLFDYWHRTGSARLDDGEVKAAIEDTWHAYQAVQDAQERGEQPPSDETWRELENLGEAARNLSKRARELLPR